MRERRGQFVRILGCSTRDGGCDDRLLISVCLTRRSWKLDITSGRISSEMYTCTFEESREMRLGANSLVMRAVSLLHDCVID